MSEERDDAVDMMDENFPMTEADLVLLFGLGE